MLIIYYILNGCRCITTFEVLYSEKSPGGPFKRVNEIDVIFTSFHHMMSQGKICLHFSSYFKLALKGTFDHVNLHSKSF